METVKSGPRLPHVAVASAVLLAAGLTPAAAAPEISTQAVATVSAEVTLAGNAVVDGFSDLQALAGTAAFDVPGTASALDVSGAADTFDIAGLFNAELAAAQGFFNSLFSLPGTLFNGVQNVVTDLVNHDFGLAFSAAVTIPQDIINYVLGLPGLVANTAFNMVVVLPGEYLFNFS